MRAEKPIFCQVMDWIHPEQFRRCVQRYNGNHILQILSVNVFEQVPLAELVAKTGLANDTCDIRNQLVFNGF